MSLNKNIIGLFRKGYNRIIMKEIILAFDPLCMWSYAYAHILEEFLARHRNEFFTSVVCSGMIRGDLTVGAARQKEKLLYASQMITEQSGIGFGPRFYENIENNSIILDSVPGSTAVNIMKHLNKPKALEFALDLSRNIFAHGMDPGDHHQIARLMGAYGISPKEALTSIRSDNGKYLAYQDFQWFEATPMRRTPALLLQVSGELIQLTQGYTPGEKLEEVYQAVVKKYDFSLN